MLNIVQEPNPSTEEHEEEEDVFEIEDSDEPVTVRNPPQFSTLAYVPYSGPCF